MYYYKGNWPRIAEEDYVLDPSLTAIYSEALTQYPMWHRVGKGAINCLQWHVDEPLWVRNFKRGLLTNFQQDPSQPEIWEVSTAEIGQNLLVFMHDLESKIRLKFMHKVLPCFCRLV